MPLFVNNVAICLLRDEGGRADAEALLEDAAKTVSVEGQVEKVAGNLELLREWRAGGWAGSYKGALLW
jgi:hypothetical protein